VSLLLPLAAVSRFKLVLAKSTAPPSFVAGMQRRQCVALCFIFMLAGAEAARTAESANVMHSVVLHSGRRSSQSFEGTMDVAGSEMIPSSDSLMRRLTALNTSAEDVQDGKGFWRVKNCMMTCPLIWTKIIYHSWLARSDAKKIVADSFAAGDDVAMLPSVSQLLGDSFRGTMRKTVWTFLKVIDDSVVQRILLALFFAPLGLFRVLTKMSPLGLCFLKQAWKDLEANEDY
ncbi:Gbe1, partial [Symbiodinium necroappetens]